MSDRITKTHKDLIRNYIRAKDDNKPHLMESVFSVSSILNMELKTENISFPSEAVGLDSITDVLVRSFGNSYENVYTYCLTDSLDDRDHELFCTWLVVMSDKESGSVRVGCGQYHWRYVDEPSSLVNHLSITIDQMSVLPSDTQPQIYEGLRRLPYPWCDSTSVLEAIPLLEPLRSIREYFNQ